MSTRKPQLSDAYALQTPEDSVRLYADWAATYDQGFAEASHYILPMQVAEAFVAAGGKGPVLDVGAGTGLCAQQLLHHQTGPIDATDISQDMLDVAAHKNIYRRLFISDLTKNLPIESNTYAGIVSSGTFTTGHVGPNAFDELLRIACPGGLFAISINGHHYVASGFDAKLKELAPQIKDMKLHTVRYYGATAKGPHKDDTGDVAVFRKR